MGVHLSLNPPSRCGTISQPLVPPFSIFVRRDFIKKKEKMSLSVMKRVNGAPHHWSAKVFMTFSVLLSVPIHDLRMNSFMRKVFFKIY